MADTSRFTAVLQHNLHFVTCLLLCINCSTKLWPYWCRIPDPEATKPDDWDEDAPEYVPDPDASQPEDWDAEEDGEWSAPMTRNPNYKGPWSPPLIDNPDYKVH